MVQRCGQKQRWFPNGQGTQGHVQSQSLQDQWQAVQGKTHNILIPKTLHNCHGSYLFSRQHVNTF